MVIVVLCSALVLSLFEHKYVVESSVAHEIPLKFPSPSHSNYILPVFICLYVSALPCRAPVAYVSDVIPFGEFSPEGFDPSEYSAERRLVSHCCCCLKLVEDITYCFPFFHKYTNLVPQ